ncbi:MAG: hypothetical protein O2782_07375 [bacterium]|nr:hypothetical protein [bacterium]
MPLPLTIIIDDPAPLINVYWWHAAESQHTDEPVLSTGEPVIRDIPVDFLEQFILAPTGVTSPWDFGIGVEEQYRLAIRQAMAGIGVDQTWYFLHADVTGTAPRSHVAWRQGDRWLWQTMETLHADDA